MKALEGLLVVSIEQAVAAPFCSARLAEAGARVIKVEREAGDFARLYDRAGGDDSSYFVWLNQGKQSLVLDYKTPEDAELLENLLAKADVFIQNLAPGALDRAGFGSAALRERHPRLVTCDISGYGEDPAVADLKAYDLLVQAESGLVSISGGPGELGRVGVSVVDIGAGMTAHAAILEALFNRERTGRGEAVKVSLFDVTAEWMTVPLLHHEHGNGAPTREGLHHPSLAPYGAYETNDGILTLLSIQNEREWLRFCAIVLELPDLPSDPKFASNNDRVANRPALDAVMNSVVGAIDAGTFRSRMAKASIAYGAVNSVADLSTHRALTRRTVTSSTGKQINIPAAAIRAGQVPRRAETGAPGLGEHSEAIRKEFQDRSAQSHPEGA